MFGSPPLHAKQVGKKGMIYGAPLTRQTLDDPSYKGMVLAPFMYPDLSESEYEHMAKCASDVVQFRVDEEVFTGKASDIIVRPVPIRDYLERFKRALGEEQDGADEIR